MEPSQAGERLASIERRLAAIEQRLGIQSAEKSAPASAAAPAWTRAVPAQEARLASLAQQEKSGNWLGIIAVICFVLAAGFIIKLSIDSGWLTPPRQIGLAALVGLSLIAAALALLRADRAYASLLPGAGIIILYLSAVAAHSYYILISFDMALAVISVVSLLCIWLYTRIRHDAYAITAAIGSYAAPALLGLQEDMTFSLYYFLLCSLAFAVLSIWVRSRTLTMVSAYLAIIMTGLIGGNLGQDQLIAILLALHFLVFSIGTYLYSRQHGSVLTDGEAVGFLPVLFIFYALEYYYIDRIAPGLAPWISLLFAAFIVALYFSAKAWFSAGPASGFLTVSFATLIGFHAVYLELIPADFRPWLFVLIVIGFACFPVRATKFRNIHIAGLALLAIAAIEYVRMLFHLWDEGDSAYWLAVSFAALASLWVALLSGNSRRIAGTDWGGSLLGAAHVLALMAFYRLTHEAGSLAVSASWLFYAVAVIAVAFLRRDEIMAKSAMFVLAFAAGKALLYDAASAPTIVRILCLLLTGGVLYACGFLMRKITHWSTPHEIQQALT